MVWTNQVQNLVLVAGTGISGIFVYDPSAGAGNLIGSMTDAAADPFGNVTEKGVSAYVIDINSIREAVNLNASNINGMAGLSIRDTAHPPFAPPGVYGQGSGAAPGASKAVAFLDSGLVANADVDAVVTAQSQTHSGVTGGVVNLLAGQMTLGNTSTLVVNDNTGALTLGQPVATPASTAGSQIFSSTNGVPSIETVHGLAGQLPAIQSDNSPHSVGNTASAGNITKTWSIPGSDAVAGTSYVLRTFASFTIGQTTAETLTIGISLNGVNTALATLGAAFNGGTLSATYDLPLELTVQVDAAGVDTPQIALSGPLGNTSANRLATNSANMAGHSNVLTFTKANTNTVALYAQWGGTGGSVQTISTIWSKLYREGP